MENDKTAAELTSGGNRSSLLLVLSIIAVIIVAGAAIFLSVQKAALSDQNERLDSEIEDLESEIQALEGQKVEAALLSQQWLDAIEDQEIRWSRVISRIDSLIPYDPDTNIDKVIFLSYSGSDDGSINLNAQTRTTDEEPFNDVAEVIATYNDSPNFRNAYVPSITRGETDQGLKVGTYTLSLEYTEETPKDIESTISVEEPEEESERVSIPVVEETAEEAVVEEPVAEETEEATEEAPAPRIPSEAETTE